jgi:hypothetical protein
LLSLLMERLRWLLIAGGLILAIWWAHINV